jgi:type II secretory pathway pseudopilin PulG
MPRERSEVEGFFVWLKFSENGSIINLPLYNPVTGDTDLTKFTSDASTPPETVQPAALSSHQDLVTRHNCGVEPGITPSLPKPSRSIFGWLLLRQAAKSFPGFRRPVSGITLVELLMVLLILAEIATFTIPKVLQATSLNARYAKAQETLATITELTYNYALQNGGCFPGNLTCKFDKTTGTIQDGKANFSNNVTPSYDNFEAYLDSHLNYVQKGLCAGTSACWTLPNGTTYQLNILIKNPFRPGRYELCAVGAAYLDTTIAQQNATQYSYGGVDADEAAIYTFANGGAYGGINNYNLGTGNSPYNPAYTDIFDLREHPEDTCVAVGGWQCGL